jgi:hypothetical protein
MSHPVVRSQIGYRVRNTCVPVPEGLEVIWSTDRVTVGEGIGRVGLPPTLPLRRELSGITQRQLEWPAVVHPHLPAAHGSVLALPEGDQSVKFSHMLVGFLIVLIVIPALVYILPALG